MECSAALQVVCVPACLTLPGADAHDGLSPLLPPPRFFSNADLRDERDLNILTRLGCGAVAGTVGQTVAYPFDVARRRLQVSGWQGALALHAEQGQVVVYRGMADCFVRTMREEGVQALFKVSKVKGGGGGGGDCLADCAHRAQRAVQAPLRGSLSIATAPEAAERPNSFPVAVAGAFAHHALVKQPRKTARLLPNPFGRPAYLLLRQPPIAGPLRS